MGSTVTTTSQSSERNTWDVSKSQGKGSLSLETPLISSPNDDPEDSFVGLPKTLGGSLELFIPYKTFVNETVKQGVKIKYKGKNQFDLHDEYATSNTFDLSLFSYAKPISGYFSFGLGFEQSSSPNSEFDTCSAVDVTDGSDPCEGISEYTIKVGMRESVEYQYFLNGKVDHPSLPFLGLGYVRTGGVENTLKHQLTGKFNYSFLEPTYLVSSAVYTAVPGEEGYKDTATINHTLALSGNFFVNTRTKDDAKLIQPGITSGVVKLSAGYERVFDGAEDIGSDSQDKNNYSLGVSYGFRSGFLEGKSISDSMKFINAANDFELPVTIDFAYKHGVSTYLQDNVYFNEELQEYVPLEDCANDNFSIYECTTQDMTEMSDELSASVAFRTSLGAIVPNIKSEFFKEMSASMTLNGNIPTEIPDGENLWDNSTGGISLELGWQFK